MRRSSDAIAITSSASQRSWASMKRSSSSRSFALGGMADQSCAMGGQMRLHGHSCTLQRTVRRSHRRVEDRRCLDRGIPEHVAQDQRGPLARRQHLHGGEERQLDGLAVDGDLSGCVRGRCQFVEQAIRVRLQPRHLGERVQLGELARTTPQQIEADVGGDPVEPGSGLTLDRRTFPARARRAGRPPVLRPRPLRTTPAFGSNERATRGDVGSSTPRMSTRRCDPSSPVLLDRWLWHS